MTTFWSLKNMKNTQEDIFALDNDTIVMDEGRVFHSAHKDLLKSLPSDMVKELARRGLEDIGRIKSGRAGKNRN